MPDLPQDGRADLGSVSLPRGRRLRGDDASDPTPSIWATNRTVRDPAGVWTALQLAHGETGLVPILLDGLWIYKPRFGRFCRPWDSLEFGSGTVVEIDELNVEEVLAEWWSGVSEDEERAEPFGRGFPGLAPPTPGESSFDDALRDVAGSRSRIGLVVADRPADIVGLVGWGGAVNADQKAATLSVVLRSWEERFDARLVRLGFDTMVLLVGRPPRSLAEALPIAAEQYAFCVDIVNKGLDSVSALAENLVGASRWPFWWDYFSAAN